MNLSGWWKLLLLAVIAGAVWLLRPPKAASIESGESGGLASIDGYVRSTQRVSRGNAGGGMGLKKIAPGDNGFGKLVGTSIAKDQLLAICSESPQEALEFLQECEIVLDVKLQAVELALRNLARTNPKLAIRYMGGYEDVFKKQAMPGIISAWLKKDPVSAGEWLMKIKEESPGKDESVLELIRYVAAYDKDTAWTWLGEISDPKMRSNASTLLEDINGGGE